MPVDKVLLAAPRGFCAGVEMAIKALAWMVRAFEPPVYCYHEIVHNQLVVDRFRDLGVVFVDDIDEVPEGTETASISGTQLREKLQTAERELEQAEAGSEAARVAERDKRRAESFLALVEGGSEH